MKNTRSRELSPEELEKYREWGRQGGRRTLERHGTDHLREIGAKGGDVIKKRAGGEITEPREKKTVQVKPRSTISASTTQSATDSLNDFV